MIWWYLGLTFPSISLLYWRLLFLNYCFPFWQKLTFTDNNLTIEPRTLRRQYRYYSNIIKPFQQRHLCLLTYLQSHWFARNLVASYPTFFIRQPLHLPAAPASPKCTHAEKLETFIRPDRDRIQGTVALRVVVIIQITDTPSHPTSTGSELQENKCNSSCPAWECCTQRCRAQSSKLWHHSCCNREFLVIPGK